MYSNAYPGSFPQLFSGLSSVTKIRSCQSALGKMHPVPSWGMSVNCPIKTESEVKSIQWGRFVPRPGVR